MTYCQYYTETGKIESYIHIWRVSCQKGRICHASAWRVGPFWQDIIDLEAIVNVCTLIWELLSFISFISVNITCFLRLLAEVCTRTLTLLGPAPFHAIVDQDRPCGICSVMSLITRFMGLTWGPPWAARTQVGPTLATRTLISGVLSTWQFQPFICWIRPFVSIYFMSLIGYWNLLQTAA